MKSDRVDTFAAPNSGFQTGVRAPLSINPRNTPGFSPGCRMGLFQKGSGPFYDKMCYSDRLKSSAGGVLLTQENEKGLKSASRRRLGGRAKLLVFALILVLAFAFLRCLHPFLAVSDPVPGGIIAIEGWIREIDIEQTVYKIDPAHDRDIYIISAIPGSSYERESVHKHSEYLAARLKSSGVPAERVHSVLYKASKKDRTYHMAVALRSWLRDRDISVSSLNVITKGAHARRSRLLFRKAFGGKVKVGVIPTGDLAFDPAHWWRSRFGVGHMIYQGFAYIYAKFLFHPN